MIEFRIKGSGPAIVPEFSMTDTRGDLDIRVQIGDDGTTNQILFYIDSDGINTLAVDDKMAMALADAGFKMNGNRIAIFS